MFASCPKNGWKIWVNRYFKFVCPSLSHLYYIKLSNKVFYWNFTLLKDFLLFQMQCSLFVCVCLIFWLFWYSPIYLFVCLFPLSLFNLVYYVAVMDSQHLFGLYWFIIENGDSRWHNVIVTFKPLIIQDLKFNVESHRMTPGKLKSEVG